MRDENRNSYSLGASKVARLDDIERMKARTKAFALSIVKLYSGLPKSTEASILGRQMLRSGTSIGAQYREAIRAKSDADFISKIEGCLQELEETRYWLELLKALNMCDMKFFDYLDDEADQLIAILTTVVKKIKTNS